MFTTSQKPYSVKEITEKYELPITVKKYNWKGDFYFKIEKVIDGIATGTTYKDGNIYHSRFRPEYKFKMEDELYIINERSLKEKKQTREPAVVPVGQESDESHMPQTDITGTASTKEHAVEVLTEREYNYGRVDEYPGAQEYEPDNHMTLFEKNRIIDSFSNKEKSFAEDTELIEKEEKRNKVFARMDLDTAFSPWNDSFKQHYHTKVYISENAKGRIEVLGNQTVWQVEAGLYTRFSPKEFRAGYNYDWYYDSGLVVDWRSPIAELYYQDDKVSLTHKTRFVYGHGLMLKRRFEGEKFSDLYIAGRVENKDEGSFDPFLINILEERKSSHQLEAIIQTIQSNQNSIIREDLDRNMIVQGCAGSGKTMILLHRLSYLMYNNPKLSEKEYEIITPNKIFDAHIDALSKRLELNKVRRRTPEEFYLDLLHCFDPEYDVFKSESADGHENVELSEYVFSDGFKDELKRHTYIADERKYADALDALNIPALVDIERKAHLNVPLPHIKGLAQEEQLFLLRDYRDSILKKLQIISQCKESLNKIDREIENERELARKLYRQRGVINKKQIKEDTVHWLSEYLRDEQTKLKNLADIIPLSEAQQKASEERIVISDGTDYSYVQYLLKAFNISEEIFSQNMISRVHEDQYGKLSTFFDRKEAVYSYAEEKGVERSMVESVDSSTLETDIKTILDSGKTYSQVSDKPQYFKLFSSIYPDIVKKRFPQIEISNADRSTLYAALLFSSFIAEESGKISDIHFKGAAGTYFFIDEAQDISPAEYNLLHKLIGDYAVFNLYGDVGQVIKPYCTNAWERILDLADFSIKSINENYRNTVKITAFTNEKLGRDDTAIGIVGSDIAYLDFRDLSEDFIGDLDEHSGKRIAVIVHSSDTSLLDKFPKECADRIVLNNISDDCVSLLSVANAKGLEFDKVYVYEDGMSDNERYIAYTRALSELVILENRPAFGSPKGTDLFAERDKKEGSVLPVLERKSKSNNNISLKNASLPKKNTIGSMYSNEYYPKPHSDLNDSGEFWSDNNNKYYNGGDK